MDSDRRWMFILVIVVMTSLLVSACSGAAATAAPTDVPVEEETMEDEHMEDEHMEDEHMEDEHMEDEHEEEMDEHMEGEDHDEEMDEHMDEDHSAAGHDVPEAAAAVPNPIEADDASRLRGQDLFATNCSTCHGDEGKGDGPASAALDPPPANLGEDHVQVLTDGALFHIITHGVEGSAMVAWEEAIEEDGRWDLVNFLRTIGE
jgi:mono/diheme cytochrome c family protein